jgi:hypothetical protein
MPTAASLKFGDIENLMLSLGAKVIEGNGSRVAFEIKNKSFSCIGPIPEKKRENIRSKHSESF